MSANLNKFTSMLDHISTNFYNTPLNTSFSSAKLEPTFPEMDEWDLEAERKKYNPPFWGVYRPKHSLVEATRNMALVEACSHYLIEHGTPEIKDSLDELIRSSGGLETFIQRVMCAMAFRYAGFESEVPEHLQPETHQYYRFLSGARFSAMRHNAITKSEGYEKLHIVAELFPKEETLKFYREQLSANPGDKTNTNPLYVLFNMADMLGQYSSLDQFESAKQVGPYFREHSTGEYGPALHALRQYAHQLIANTHDKNRTLNFGRNKGKFRETTLDPVKAIAAVNAAPAPNVHTKLAGPEFMKNVFLFKSISGATLDGKKSLNAHFVDGLLHGPVSGIDKDSYRLDKNVVTSRAPSPVDSGSSEPKHNEATISLIHRNDGHYQSGKQPYTGYFSQTQSTSIADPSVGFCPPAFKFNSDQTCVYAGWAFERKNTQIVRMSYDFNTHVRAHEASSIAEAQRLSWNQNAFTSVEEVTHTASVHGRTIEAMAKLSEPKAAVIFDDYPTDRHLQLVNRIVTQARAKELAQRFNMRDEEFGLPRGTREPYKIYFQTGLADPQHGMEYTLEEQKADRDFVSTRTGSRSNLMRTLSAQNQKALVDAIAQLNTPAPLSYIAEWKVTPFQVGCANGRLPEERTAADINYQDTRGYTAMHYAAANGHIALLTQLINTPGAEPNLLSHKGENVIDTLARCHHLVSLGSIQEFFHHEPDQLLAFISKLPLRYRLNVIREMLDQDNAVSPGFLFRPEFDPARDQETVFQTLKSLHPSLCFRLLKHWVKGRNMNEIQLSGYQVGELMKAFPDAEKLAYKAHLFDVMAARDINSLYKLNNHFYVSRRRVMTANDAANEYYVVMASKNLDPSIRAEFLQNYQGPAKIKHLLSAIYLLNQSGVELSPELFFAGSEPENPMDELVKITTQFATKYLREIALNGLYKMAGVTPGAHLQILNLLTPEDQKTYLEKLTQTDAFKNTRLTPENIAAVNEIYEQTEQEHLHFKPKPGQSPLLTLAQNLLELGGDSYKTRHLWNKIPSGIETIKKAIESNSAGDLTRVVDAAMGRSTTDRDSKAHAIYQHLHQACQKGGVTAESYSVAIKAVCEAEHIVMPAVAAAGGATVSLVFARKPPTPAQNCGAGMAVNGL